MNKAILELPTYSSLMLGERQPRGYPNMMAIREDAFIKMSHETVSARLYFSAIESEMRLMSEKERQALLSVLNFKCLERYPIEFPFRMPPSLGLAQNAIEIFYSDSRYIMYVEFADDVGLHKLVRFQKIPLDSTNPVAHLRRILS